MERVSAIAGDQLIEGDATPGLVRKVAFTTERAIVLRTRAEGSAASGWHHHGDRDVFGHLLCGHARFEFGPGGREYTDVPEGGFFHIPAGLVHRDVNPFDEAHEMVISFVGSGPLVVNVDGPDPG